jgi:sulfate permease, SulP family
MAVDAAEGGPSQRTNISAWARDGFAGAICSVLSVAYCLSYAALIFAGPLSHWLSYGVALTFMSAAVAAAVVALRSSLPFAVAGPDSGTSAIMAALVAAMIQRLVADGRTTDLLVPTLIAIAMATAITGVLLCMLGFTRAGRAIRFVPFPVIGGFLGATGWLMVTGAVQVITDHKVTFDELEKFVRGLAAAQLAAGIAVAIVLQLLISRSQSAFILPGVLLVAIVGTHIALPVAGISLAEVQAAGWMFRPQPAASLISPWQWAELQAFPWKALPWLAGDMIAVMFVTTITLLLNTTGVEMATRREANIERELKALGIANLATAAFGGVVSCLSLSRTTLNDSLGATGRLSGLTVAAVSAAVLVADPAFLGYIPKFALGGLLFFAGGRLFYRWMVDSARQVLLIDYLSLLAIAVIIIQWGFIAGVLIGILIGCATFALSASRVNAIKFSFDGSEYRSSLDRSSNELALLAKHGREIQGMALQSYLFFGSANRLYEHVKQLLARRPECRFLLFDFRLVTGVDSSATHSFSQIHQAAHELGAKLVLVNVTPAMERAFQASGFAAGDVAVVGDLDRALESCEQAVIDRHWAEGRNVRSLNEWLAEALGSTEYADKLAARCKRLDIETGGVIAKQGEPADSMHFILDGRVGIIVDLGDGRSVRVRSLGAQTTIGEMGLIAGRPRSATIRAEVSSVLYELSIDTYEQIKRDDPALGQALLAYIVAVMGERLNFANRMVGVLQR